MNKWRFYCEDEATNIFVNAVNEPTACPNGSHIIRDGTIVCLGPTIPDVTARQIRVALFLSMGIVEADIDAAINTLSDPAKTVAMIEWKQSNMFVRDRPLVATMGAMLGKTSEEMDNLWLYAGTL